MQNFEFHNPTRILFGQGQIAHIGPHIPADARILLLYGRGSIMRNGVYDQVRAALAGRRVGEFNGIEPNPTYETLMGAVALAQDERYDFLLAVGGGSVLDGTKFVAAAAPFDGDPWDIVTGNAPIAAALPVGAVLTLPGTGSESNMHSVISRRTTREKLSFGHPLLYPRFAVLDPATTISLPARQVANGIVDAFTHVAEQYLTFPADAPLQDRFAESILRTLIEEGPKTLADPTDYTARANLVWCATMALNGLIGLGVPEDWATHTIGHELTALHGLDHAQTLAVVLPSVLQARRAAKGDKLLQYAERVWNLRHGDAEARIDAAIARTRWFFESLGVPTRLSGYGLDAGSVLEIPRRLEARGDIALGERGDITPEVVEQILVLST